MLRQIAVDRGRDDQRHAEVLDVAEFLSTHGDYGSGSNALVVMIRQSPIYKDTLVNNEFKKWLSARNKGRKADCTN